MRKVARSFHQIPDTEPEQAARHLDALVAVANRDPAQRGAGERAYRHGYAAVAKWTGDARQRAFGNTRVPTKDGGWRSGREVIAEDNGVAAAHVLAREYAALLPTRNDDLPGREVHPNNGPEDDELDIEVLRTRSVSQHREFLEGWRGSIPPGIGGCLSRRRRAEITGRWRATAPSGPADATMNIDHELDELGRDRTTPVLCLIEGNPRRQR